MSGAGWTTMILCWTFVIGFSVYLVIKTLRVPPHSDTETPPR